MAGTAAAKRKADESKLRARPNKKFKKQTHYSSGSDGSEGENGASATHKARPNPGRDNRKIQSLSKQKIKLPVSASKTFKKAGRASSDREESDDDEASDITLSQASSSDADSDSDDKDDGSDSASETSENGDPSSNQAKKKKKTKRSDPDAFASSISAILGSKLSEKSRADPVLSRSREAASTSHSLAESRLEVRARRKLRDEKRALNERGRVRDVLLGDRKRTPGPSESEAEDQQQQQQQQQQNGNAKTKNSKSSGSSGNGASGTQSAAEIAEQERKLRKTAQRGVVKLFNAVRAAQVKGEEAARQAKQRGVIGIDKREEKVGEMGRQAFLDLVGAGGGQV